MTFTYPELVALRRLTMSELTRLEQLSKTYPHTDRSADLVAALALDNRVAEETRRARWG
jgi:hypothetical protein